MSFNVFLARSATAPFAFGAGVNTNFLLFFPVDGQIGGTSSATLSGQISAGNFGPGSSGQNDNTTGNNTSPSVIVDTGNKGKVLKLRGTLVQTRGSDYPTLTGSDVFIFANSSGANQTASTMPSVNKPEDIARAIDDYFYDQFVGNTVFVTGKSGTTAVIATYVLGLPMDQGGLGGPVTGDPTAGTLAGQNYRFYQGLITKFDWSFQPGNPPSGPIDFSLDFQVGNVGTSN